MKTKLLYAFIISLCMHICNHAGTITIKNNTGRDMVLIHIDMTVGSKDNVPLPNNNSYSFNTNGLNLNYITYGYATSNPNEPYAANKQLFNEVGQLADAETFTLIDCGNDSFSAIPEHSQLNCGAISLLGKEEKI